MSRSSAFPLFCQTSLALLAFLLMATAFSWAFPPATTNHGTTTPAVTLAQQ